MEDDYKDIIGQWRRLLIERKELEREFKLLSKEQNQEVSVTIKKQKNDIKS